jgi:hypothetical protein
MQWQETLTVVLPLAAENLQPYLTQHEQESRESQVDGAGRCFDPCDNSEFAYRFVSPGRHKL